MFDQGRAVYTIGTAAELLGLHPRTLRLYEDGGLLRPARKNNRRYYSVNDLQWINCVRFMIHEKGLNQEGMRRILALIPCWEINGCSAMVKASCAAMSDRTTTCWDLARGCDDGARQCHQCHVYLSAADFLLDESEKEQALAYMP